MGLWNNIASRSRSKSDGADPFAAGLPIGDDNNPNIPEIIDPKHRLQCTENGLRDEMGLPKRESYRRLCGFHESSVSSRLRVSPKRQALRVPRGLCPLRVALGLLWRPWVCSRFAKEVAPPFPCRTVRDAPAVCVRLGRRSQTWNPLFGRGQPKVRGGQDSRRSTGNRGESSPSSEGSAASSPIQANDSAVSADVTVSVEPTVGSTSVTFKYKLTNDSAQTVWAVHSPAVSVMPASGRKTGVVAAMALSRSQGRQLRPAAVRGRCQA